VLLDRYISPEVPSSSVTFTLLDAAMVLVKSADYGFLLAKMRKKFTYQKKNPIYFSNDLILNPDI